MVSPALKRVVGDGEDAKGKTDARPCILATRDETSQPSVDHLQAPAPAASEPTDLDALGTDLYSAPVRWKRGRYNHWLGFLDYRTGCRLARLVTCREISGGRGRIVSRALTCPSQRSVDGGTATDN